MTGVEYLIDVLFSDPEFDKTYPFICSTILDPEVKRLFREKFIRYKCVMTSQF